MAGLMRKCSSWGGSRRSAPPSSIDEGPLLDAFGRHASLISNMGSYESRSVSDQPCGKGILALAGLVRDIIKISPACLLPIPLIRKALSRLVFQQPTINGTIYNNGLWSNLRQERITCVLNHTRRLRREEERLRQVALKLSSPEFQELQGILSEIKIDARDLEVDAAADSDFEGTVDMNTEEDPATADDLMSVPAEATSSDFRTTPARGLKRHVSEASVDSDGFPRVLSRAPEKSKPKWELDVSTKETASAEMKASMRHGSSSPVPQEVTAKAKAKGKAKPKAQAVAHDCRSYTKMYYKNSKGFGIRRCFDDKKQVISVCKSSANKADLECIADQVMKKLKAGEQEDVVKTWAQSAVARLK